MSSKLKKIFRFWAPPIIWGILIYSGSSEQSISLSAVYWQDLVIHKLAHIIEYSILGILIYRALIHEKMSRRTAVMYAIIISLLYGISDEFHQKFPLVAPIVSIMTSLRRGLLVDTIGATSGILIVWKLLPKMPKKLLNLAEKLDLL